MRDELPLERQLALLREEHKLLQEDYKALDLCTKDIKKERNNLKVEIEKLRSENEKLEREGLKTRRESLQETEDAKLDSDVLRLETSRLRKEKEELRVKTQELRAIFEADKAQSETVFELERRVQELESEVLRITPMYEIGVAIRARYLENAKFAVLTGKERKRSWNQDIRVAGDAAAHRALGNIDKTLFEDGILPTKDQENLRMVFEKLYHSKPEDYGAMHPHMQEMLDCEGTIRTMLVLNEDSRPIRERVTAFTNIEIIRTKYQKFSPEQFGADEDVLRRLERLKELTETIVVLDRKARKVTGP